jgi:phytoene synthase
MAISELHYETFKKGSKTYFNSSIFFPKSVREDVFLLYGFVRVADNFVDDIPQDSEGFYRFKANYQKALGGEEIGDPIIDGFVELAKRKNFDPKWTEAFLYSMELDLSKKMYQELDETLEYIYGSAEVIGLYMSAILDLNKESSFAACRMGRSMQYINFIRDIAEDITLGRHYLPMGETELSTLEESEVSKNKEEFLRFLRKQTERYLQWQSEAEKGYKFIPKRYRIPIKTASDMYNWTARQIFKDPFIVYKKKVKPAKWRIIFSIVKNLFFG